MPLVELPDAQVSEMNPFRPFTAPGLFAYRHLQARQLLDFPDFGDGDMTADERRHALNQAVAFQAPLAALPIFLAVVALEDFVRDLGARLADCSSVIARFPLAGGLRMKPVRQKRKFGRLDTDAFESVDPEQINKLYGAAEQSPAGTRSARLRVLKQEGRSR